MTLVGWAKKEIARLRTHNKPKKLLPPPTRPLVQDVVLAADLQCDKCQMKVADVISKHGASGIESMLVHVLEKKVTLTLKSESK